jgi:hypothetical protein
MAVLAKQSRCRFGTQAATSVAVREHTPSGCRNHTDTADAVTKNPQTINKKQVSRLKLSAARAAAARGVGRRRLYLAL